MTYDIKKSSWNVPYSIKWKKGEIKANQNENSSFLKSERKTEKIFKIDTVGWNNWVNVIIYLY